MRTQPEKFLARLDQLVPRQPLLDWIDPVDPPHAARGISSLSNGYLAEDSPDEAVVRS